MENFKVELVVPAPMQSAGAAALRPGDAMLQSRFRRALQEPSPSQAFEPHAAPGVPTQTAPAATASDSNAELVDLLQRMCAAMYVGDRSVRSQRIVVMLDHALAGAAAEIVREGVRLTVRLHATTQTAYRLMSSQRGGLVAALGSNGDVVDVAVVHGALAVNADGHDPGY